MTLFIGLTGGIGSGKSTVADLFAQRGAGVIDTDMIARKLTAAGGAAINRIRETFGQAFILADGSMDRVAMRNLVFGNDQAKQQLEAIMHPMIREEVTREMARQTSPYCLLVVPLLFETGAYSDVIARSLAIDCEESVQIRRVVNRSGLSKDEVTAIMHSQIERGRRIGLASDIIVNNDGLESLKKAVDNMNLRYLALANEFKQ